MACASASRMASAYDNSRVAIRSGATTSAGIHISRELCRIGVRARLRELERIVDLLLCDPFDCRKVRRCETSTLDQLGFEAADRIGGAPRLDLFLGAIE